MVFDKIAFAASYAHGLPRATWFHKIVSRKFEVPGIAEQPSKKRILEHRLQYLQHSTTSPKQRRPPNMLSTGTLTSVAP